MRVLVTGGAGFIGSHIVDVYIRAGHTVTVYDDLSSGSRKNLNPRARLVRGSISDRKKLQRVFRAGRFQVVNHHAAQIDVRRSVADPVLDAKINILGILNVLEMAKATGVKKVLFSSSGGTVYGECTRPAKENDPEIPLSPYGVAKLASEKYIKTYAALFGIDFTIFRYANVYGPRQDPHGEAGVVAIFSKLFINKKTPLVFGSGRQTRDFVYVGDVAEANLKGLTKGRNVVANIGTGRESSVLDLIRVMGKLKNHRVKPVRKKARTGELLRSVLNVQYASKALGWKPKTTLAAGLAKTIAYFETGKVS